MGRRKKQEQLEEKIQAKPIIHGDAKRSVVAIFLFALAFLFVLGFLSAAKILDAGILGKFLDSLGGWMFGVGKYISPIILAAAGAILLFRKETLFYISKLAGLSVSFASILGLIHILSYNPNKMLSAAEHGYGGGFLGFVLAFLFSKLAGTIGGSVIMVALALIGIIVAFNFSLVSLIRKFIKEKTENMPKEDTSVENIGNEDDGKHDIEDKKSDAYVEFVKDPNDGNEDGKSQEDDGHLDKVLKKAAAWMPSSKTKKIVREELDWNLPPIGLLETSSGKPVGGDTKKNGQIIQDTFRHFGIEVEPGEVKTGPTVTQYSFRPAVGVKLTRITSLSNDLALALAAHPIRIEAPIPGKSLIGIEVPNKTVALVRLPELLHSADYQDRNTNLLLSLGKDVSGNYIFGDLKKMPHLMIAGSTNSGKSVCVNTILISMLYQNSPEDLKLILVDPKRVELSLYNGIPHLLADVIVENGKVLSALKWAIGEMERRYKLLQSIGSRDIASYNSKAEAGEMRTIVDPDTNESKEEAVEKIPYIVIVIDELADLMSSHGKEVEGAIIRLAQMSRAVGIHLIVSTQRPSVEVITGLIKANIPTRIAFKVATQIDSRTILDSGGAEKLLGNGDMLYSSVSGGVRRLQGVYVSENEVKRVVDFIKKQKFEKIEDDLDSAISEEKTDPRRNGEVTTTYDNSGKIDFASIASGDQDDSLYEEAKNLVLQSGKASTSLLQRRLRVGYSRAARLIDMLEEKGIIGGADGAKAREILVQSGEPSYDDPALDQAARDKWQM
jgi:S-DNA-T family DNA segregation ATPase FtsK/SpoIIIE